MCVQKKIGYTEKKIGYMEIKKADTETRGGTRVCAGGGEWGSSDTWGSFPQILVDPPGRFRAATRNASAGTSRGYVTARELGRPPGQTLKLASY